jgi:DNA-3-methyladenine glycosylase I
MELNTMKTRCAWAGDDPLYVTYHDEQWGVPLHDDQELFEMLVLEGAQAGLSWSTVLNKRENYRRAFDGFEIARVAAYGEEDVQRLLADPGIVRNRLKIRSAIRNAQAVLEIQQAFGSLDAFLWQFVNGVPIQNAWQELKDIPAQTPLAEAMSKELKQRGLNFVGPTICYALMQSIGMVNDHLVDCFRYEEVKALGGG